MLRAVIDTNVVFEGLTHRGPSAKVIDAWAMELFQPCVSTALTYEYQDVLGAKLSPYRREKALMVIRALLTRCEYVPIYYSYRPTSRDPGDDFVVDCVLNSRAPLVTQNVRDFLPVARRFGFPVIRPAGFMALIERGL